MQGRTDHFRVIAVLPDLSTQECSLEGGGVVSKITVLVGG